jgi:predicted PurR-regulated permease PerM
MIGTKERAIFWLIIFVVSIGFVAAVSDILLPFVVALLVAYFLDPAADKLEKLGLSRTSATAVITCIFFAVIALIGVILLPIIGDQLVLLVEKIPTYIEKAKTEYGAQLKQLIATVSNGSAEQAEQMVTDYSGQVLSVVGGVAANLLQSGAAFLSLISLMFITPVVSFFVLRDWDVMVAKIDTWYPRKNAKVIREQLDLVDKTLSGYIRGQSNVCMILAVFYGSSLSIVGLDFGLLIGITTGVLTFLPYVGMFMGMTAGLTVAFFQYGLDAESLITVAAVYIVGQVIEGNFITPKLVGESVGLHPVWIIFGLLAGGTLFGFVGVLIAIPVTGIIGVLARFLLSIYMKGEIYSGGKVVKKTPAKTANKKVKVN